MLELNEQAQRRIAAPTQLLVVPGATHLFEEPGALEEVSRAGGRFFLQHLAASPS